MSFSVCRCDLACKAMKFLLIPSTRTKPSIFARNDELGFLGSHSRMSLRPKFRSSMWMIASSGSNDKLSSLNCGPLRAITVDRQVGLHEELPVKIQENSHEELIEKVIYRFRFFTILGVSGSLVGSMLCFLKGSIIIASSFMEYFITHGKVISMLIEAIDVYLIGTVMLVFGMGLYELFISNLDIGKKSPSRSNFLGLFMLQERPKWLEIKSVNELKTKLGHVIVMVLLVGLFEKSKKVMISTPIDLLCFAASILFSSCGLFLLSKLKH